MNFFLQLRLLIWKNFTLRRRHWIRLLIEIIWPLLLFIILVLVRLRGLRHYYHQCFFDEKAMPSSGLVNFAQSFICTFNNTCHQESRDESYFASTYNDSFISELVEDVEFSLEKNFNQDDVDALTKVFKDFYTVQKVVSNVQNRLMQNQGISGLDVTTIALLIKDEKAFKQELQTWADSKNISLKPEEVNSFIGATLRPELITPMEVVKMFSDPRTAICDPKIVSKLIEAKNMTNQEVQDSLKPLCNLSLDHAMELIDIAKSNLDLEQIKKELEEFALLNGGKQLSFSEYGVILQKYIDILTREGLNYSNYEMLLQVSENIRRDILEKPSIKKVMADMSDYLRELRLQLTLEVNNDASDPNNTSITNTLFMRNTSENMRLAFAAFQRVVCGRNMSVAQLFSDGGAANRFDQLRDQLKEKDEDIVYLYDNSTSKECNEIIRKLEENKLSRFLWDQLKPFVRGKILYTPDTPATKKLVGMVNDTFAPIEDMRRLTHMWINSYSERVKGLFLDKENQELIKDMFTVQGAGTFLDFALNNNITKALNESGASPLLNKDQLLKSLEEYFNGNFSERWEENFKTFDKLMSDLSIYLSCFEFNKFVPVRSEHDLEVMGIKLINENKLWAGLVFPEVEKYATELPEFIRYKIRLDSDRVDTTRYIEDRLSRPGPRRRPGIDLKYLYFGFAYLQDMLEHSIIAIQSGRNKSQLPGISLQQMPYPCYIEDRFIIAIARTFPMFMTLAWVYSASVIIKSIVYEKEKRLKEVMRVMGLGNGVHWLSWFIDSFSLMSISACLLTIILCYGGILTRSDPTVVFVFMQSYTVCTITLCFFLSTLFSRANVAAAAGGILYFCFYLPYSFMVIWEEKLHATFKIVSCLISNIAFGFGCAYFSHYEESGKGAQWSNIWTSPILEDKFSMAGSIGMMWIDSCLYALLAWYIEAVWPGQFGVPKPWYFFLTKGYWIGTNKVGEGNTRDLYVDGSLSEDAEVGESRIRGGIKNKWVEEEPTHLPLGVSVQHLSKVYPNGKIAVEDLNLNFYEGQITSFLGHNGAGKTTTISILTGLFPPSSGTAQINGLDIRKDMDSIRQSLGTCPQHNVLFDSLTVFEHLWFYARLKGKDSKLVEEEADNMIADLGLSHKRNEISKNLSGGMQRKLSIASAFVGGSRTVVLDEPTAGVDPYSRRSIWDLLIKYKTNRTIILTTHFMDEADLLGDRIAIINNGKLVCVGSSLFLRMQFGNGYYLTIVKDTDQNQLEEENVPKAIDEENSNTEEQVTITEDSKYIPLIVEVAEAKERASSADAERQNVAENFMQSAESYSFGSENIENDIIIDDEGISDVSKKNGIVINPSKANEHAINYPITKFIQKYIPSARLLEQIGSEVIYVLPTDDQKLVQKFEQFFTELDHYLEKLKIKTYGLSDTTLEEIFLKVASNPNDIGNELISRHFDEYTDPGIVTNRVRSASESSGLRYLFSDKKMKANAAGNNIRNEQDPADKSVPLSDIEVKSPDRVKKPKVPKITQKYQDGKSLFWAHLKALEIKRFNHSKRNRKGILCEILLPAIFVCLAMVFTLILPPLEEQGAVELHPWVYPTSGDYPISLFYSNSHRTGDWPRRYEEELLSKTGMGARCISSKIYPDLKSCRRKPTEFSFMTNDSELENIKTTECSCDIGTQQCPANAEGPEPPKALMPSYDILFNLTGRNISDYLIKTRDDFYKRRYGGFEFGIRNPLANRNFSFAQEITDRWLKATNLGESRLDATVNDLIFGNLEDIALSSSVFDNVRVWFNNKGWTSSVAHMSAINNVILRASIKAKQESLEDISFDFNQKVKEPHKFGFSVINHPMNYTKDQLNTEVIRQIGISLLHAICIIFAMSFVPASFVIFHIEERVTKVKHLQFVSGVKPITYWVAAFLWDMTMFIFSASICILIFVAFDAQAYVSADNFPGLLVIMFLYGLSAIPMLYPASFIFSVPSLAFVTLSCTNLFIGIITTTTTFVLENFEDEELKYVGSILKEVFLIFPHYCLGRGLMDMATEMNINLIVARFGFVSVRSRFSWNFLGKYMVCMVIQSIFWFLVTLLIQYRLWNWIPRCWKRKGGNGRIIETETDAFSDQEEDEDVLQERTRILTNENDTLDDVLIVQNLLKKYSKKSKPAVDRLTFGVKKGECFGLLGVNGAGKTTTFKMLTGDTDPTSGDAFVNGHSILTHMQNVRQSLGYCPQFDALNPLLTGREHLKLFGRLRGLDKDSVKRVADWGLRKLGLIPYADRCAGTYSGGNKRKLQTAISLVGNPSIVFLDEPTTGMDPGARRFLWNCILEMIRAGQSVVLTSHSMEECEALCTRMGIMVNGKFKCLGSTQHLKNRFGSGYTLTLRSNGKPGSLDRLKEMTQKLFPLHELKEEHFNQLQYQLPLKHTKLPLVFREMQRAKGGDCLEDYSITQTTLDEVFIRFASKQTEIKEVSENEDIILDDNNQIEMTKV